MKHPLLSAAWRKAALVGGSSPAGAAAHRPSRSRRPAWPDLLPLNPHPAGGSAAEDDDDFDSSWFASSRALAQGLQVTEHSASLEALMHRRG